MARLGCACAVLLTVVAGVLASIDLPAAALRGPDGLLVTACCWALRAAIGWLLIAILLSAIEAVLDLDRGTPPAGSLARVNAAVAPPALRAAVRFVVRGGLVVATTAAVAVPAAAQAGTSGRVPQPAATTPAGHRPSRGLDLRWPVAPATRPPEVAPPPSTTPTAPARPAGSAAPTRPAGPAVAPPRRVTVPAHVPAAIAPERREPSGAVIVRTGDSLWSIAAAHLPPSSGAADIVTAWHAWWQVNRQVIGSDPDLIHPGQRLRPPTAFSGGS